MTRMTPAVRTVMPRLDAMRALRDAYDRVFSRYPTPIMLGILSAQSALETGHWRSMWNWNFGNIRGKTRAGAWTSFRAGEIIEGREVFLAVGTGNKFRAYADAAEGAEDFVRFLGTATRAGQPNRYAAAWEAAERGDAHAYAIELGRAGYYTADPERYAKTEAAVLAMLIDDAHELTLAGEELDARDDDPDAWREGDA